MKQSPSPLQEMVDEDLKHIPEGTITAGPQKILRSAYNAFRLSHLSQNPATPRRETLCMAIASVKADPSIKANYPEWTPEFNREYFEWPEGNPLCDY